MRRFLVAFIAGILPLLILIRSGQSSEGGRIVNAAKSATRPSWLEFDADAQIRSRMVVLDAEQLNKIAALVPKRTQIFTLNLFDDVGYDVEAQRLETYGPGRFVIAGIVPAREGGDNGQALISVADGKIQAYVRGSDGRVFSIRYAGEAHEVIEVDPKRLYKCGGVITPTETSKTRHAQTTSSAIAGTPITKSKTGLPQQHNSAEVNVSSGNETTAPVIDVLIVYTPAMSQQAGGTVAMEALCQLAIAKTNQAFIDSNISAQVKLVHAQQIDYAESGEVVTDLGRLANVDDLFLVEVPALRELYAADAVHLLIAGSGGSAAGQSTYAITGNNVFPDSAIAVTTGASVPSNVFTHEFGHNFGLAHDRVTANGPPPGGNAGVPGASDYAFGYTFTGSNGVVYRTIMSYIGQDVGIFSNPAIISHGTPAGVVKSASDSADNATTITNTAAIMANFRDPARPGPAPALYSSSDHLTFTGVTPIGQSAFAGLAFNNGGVAPLEVTEFSISGDTTQFGFTPDEAQFTIAVFGGYLVVAEYTPNSYAEAEAKFTFTTNDPLFAGEKVEIPIVAHPGEQLKNLSTRLSVGTVDDVLIAGFIIVGSTPRKVLLRGIGPSLAENGVSGVLADPTIELYQGPTRIGSNDDWGSGLPRVPIANSGLAPTKSVEAAIIATLDSGSYTAILRGLGDTTGNALVEVYDLEDSSKTQLLNISTRGFVGSGDNVMIGGLIVGYGDAQLLVRAIGPTLGEAGIANPLLDPTLELHDKDGALITSNDDWKKTQQTEIEATGLAPSDDRESAILATLVPDSYTAIVRGNNHTTGVALVETYNVTP